MIMAFIDQLRAEGCAVESICRVLRGQGCQVAARTYRAWVKPRISRRMLADAQVADAVHEIVWRHETLADGSRRKVMNPEGLYGRRKMLVAVRNHTGQRVSFGSVDRAMRSFGLQYQLGDDLLINPVTEPGTQEWTTYLPAGSWVDHWTGERHAGAHSTTRHVDWDTIPVYRRG